jgi:hypothetical protein
MLLRHSNDGTNCSPSVCTSRAIQCNNSTTRTVVLRTHERCGCMGTKAKCWVSIGRAMRMNWKLLVVVKMVVCDGGIYHKVLLIDKQIHYEKRSMNEIYLSIYLPSTISQVKQCNWASERASENGIEMCDEKFCTFFLALDTTLRFVWSVIVFGDFV